MKIKSKFAKNQYLISGDSSYNVLISEEDMGGIDSEVIPSISVLLKHFSFSLHLLFAWVIFVQVMYISAILLKWQPV